MGYCGSNWISDYTYAGVMARRGPAAAIQIGAVREPSLIVWGRIRDGEVILEPAFEAVTEARMPATAGPNLLTGFDAGDVRTLVSRHDGGACWCDRTARAPVVAVTLESLSAFVAPRWRPGWELQ